MSEQVWKVPTVYKGDTVIWFDGHNSDAHGYTALVTECGRDGIVDLIAFPSSAYNGIPKSCVRHADDPNKTAINNQEDGVWTHTERNRTKTEVAHVHNKPR